MYTHTSKLLSSDIHLDFPPDEVRELAVSHSVTALISTVDKPLPKPFRLESSTLHM
jgi:hypothetical protein